MKKCPYLDCENEFAIEYSLGNCERCFQPVSTCLHCGEYNREFAKFCHMCGNEIDQNKIEETFYTGKLRKSPNIILNKFKEKKVDFLGPDETTGMQFLFFCGNRLIITTSNGYLLDWDFFADKELKKERISDGQFIVKPLVCDNMMFLAAKNTITEYNLLTHSLKDVILKNDFLSIISLIEWQKNWYGLFKDTRKNSHVFGMINNESCELEETEALDNSPFSPNMLQTSVGIFFFSKNGVYLYSREEGKGNLKFFDNFPKKSLNISAKLYYLPDLYLLQIPEQNNIIRLNIQTGQNSYFMKNLKGTYYIDYAKRRVIVADNDGLHILNYTGKQVAQSRNESSTKHLVFNYQTGCMKMVSEKILFTFAARNQGGGQVIPWRPDDGRPITNIRQVTGSNVSGDIVSNLDVSRNFIALMTSANEVLVWRF